MTDPIAEAASAQQAANEPSLLEKAQETIHQLEEKLEYMIHPDAAPSSTEPQAVSIGIENKPSLAQAPIATAEVVQEVSAAEVGESQMPSSGPAEGGQESPPASSESVEAPQSSSSPADAGAAGGEQEVAASSAGEPTAGPNTGDASSSISETSSASEKPSSESENSSSQSSDVSSKSTPSLGSSPTNVSEASSEAPNAAPTQPAGDATAVAGEEVTHIVGAAINTSDAIRTHLANIKSHLSARGFEISLVQDVHNEIAAIEKYL